MKGKDFKAGDYWAQRVDASAGLDVVGHRSLGVQYNRCIYQRREEVLHDCVQRLGLNLGSMRVLDIGCGSGFYTHFWRAQGVKDYVGIDISADAVQRLSGEYPGFRFMCRDAAKVDMSRELEGEFDLITVFDVLYHVVDDDKARSLLVNVSSLLAEDAYVLIMDQLLEKECMLTPHVKLRSRKAFEEMLNSAGLAVCERCKLFQFLAPPVFGRKSLDIGIAGLYKIVGLFMKGVESLGAVVGQAIYRLDHFLFKRGVDVPNHELIVVKRSGQTGIEAGC